MDRRPDNLTERSESKNYALELLHEARTAFEDRRDYFKKRRRSFEYYVGNQWGEKMEHPDTGETMTEEEYIESQGRIAAQNNQIGVVVRNMIGQFRNNYADPVVFARKRDDQNAGEMMTAALQAALDVNEAPEIDARNFEEFMMSACAGWKISYKWWSELNRNDVYIENIDQTRFFYNMDSTDIRGHDVNLVGEIHDMRMDQIMAAFADSPEDMKRIKRLFPDRSDMESRANHLPDYIRTYQDFYVPEDADKNRVIEVWKKEYEWQHFAHDPKDATYKVADEDYFSSLGFGSDEIELYSKDEMIQLYNQHRVQQARAQGVSPGAVSLIDLERKYEGIWRVYYLTAMGEILFESDTPYQHEGHPYIFGPYPLIDGKIRSMVETIIDQQRHINRLISMMDHNIGTASKNIMWINEDMIPEDMNRKEFANQHVELNGMMFYKPKQGVDPPQPISTHSNVAGAQEMLMMQMNLLKQISASNEAIRGEEPKSGTAASMYAQQAHQSSISNKDYFDFFFSLIRKRNRRIVQVIQEYYQDERYIRIAGTGFEQGVEQFYDPEKVQEIDFDVVIGQTQNTLAYRQMVDEYLKSFLDAQYISFEEYLKNTSLPFADKLLRTISNRKGARQGGPAGGGSGPSEGQGGPGSGFSQQMIDQIAGGDIPQQVADQLSEGRQQTNQ